MVLVESSLLPSEHSQLKEPATLRHTPFTHGLERHSLISETHASATGQAFTITSGHSGQVCPPTTLTGDQPQHIWQ